MASRYKANSSVRTREDRVDDGLRRDRLVAKASYNRPLDYIGVRVTDHCLNSLSHLRVIDAGPIDEKLQIPNAEALFR